MPSATATIRVPATTRDEFAALADAQGASLSGYLTQLARREQRAAFIAAARAEALMDDSIPAAAEEYAVWEGTLADGLD